MPVNGGRGEGETSRPQSIRSTKSDRAVRSRYLRGKHPLSDTPNSESAAGEQDVGNEGKNHLRQIRENSSANIERFLDTGRSKNAMGENNSSTGVRGVRDNASVSGLRSAARHERDRDTESSADEETNIMRRTSASRLNYQATSTTSDSQQTQNKQSGGAAKKKSSRQSLRRTTSGEENDEVEAGEHQGWWARMISKYGSVELENKGSVARDHLALERTFLAWLRTSLAFASIGIAITQL
jgi:hypothetical protein